MLVDTVNIQYLSTLVSVEALRQFDTFSAELWSTTSEKLKNIILVLSTYFFTDYVLSWKTQLLR